MLEEIVRFDDRFLARVAEMVDEEVLLRYRQCPTAFHGIFEPAGGSTNLRGYFIILPLTTACAEAIRRGEITAGKQIRSPHLAPLNQAADAAYLSVVCAVGPRARSTLIASAIRVVRNLYMRRGTRYLFARAATGAGARMLTRLTGQKFAPDGIIHEVDLSRYFTMASSE